MHLTISSPIGFIRIHGSTHAIVAIDFSSQKTSDSPVPPACLRQCARELREYFEGRRKTFSVPLEQNGTVFQTQTWQALQKISFGKTRSYADIARAIRNPKAVRAVGRANGKNSIPIIVPCHRVITSAGTLGGYSSGVWRKKWLLEHERRYC